MASPAKTFQSEIHRNLGFFATWLPGDSIAVGDVGVVENGRFRHVTSLKSLHVPYAVRKGTSSRNLQYTSTSGTNIAVNAGADIAGIAKGEIDMQFSAAGAFVFQAHGLREERIQDLRTSAAGIVEAYRNDRWEKEWVMVESVHSAEVATVVVSEDQSASLVLDAAAEGPITALSLADPKVKLTIKSTRGRLVHLIAGAGTYPLYLCVRLKHLPFGTPKVEPARGISGPDPLESMERPSLDDLIGAE